MEIYENALLPSAIRASIRNKGMLRARADCILEILSDLGTVPPGISERILTEGDRRRLEHWFALARNTRSVEEFMLRM